ncbi:hypothetical protein VTK26DRAFT_7579 [Humicola hyalothermophila]
MPCLAARFLVCPVTSYRNGPTPEYRMHILRCFSYREIRGNNFAKRLASVPMAYAYGLVFSRLLSFTIVLASLARSAILLPFWKRPGWRARSRSRISRPFSPPLNSPPPESLSPAVAHETQYHFEVKKKVVIS